MSEITTAAAETVPNYTTGQRDVLKQLRELQTQLGLSDAAFVREHLTLSSTVWSRLNSGTYQADATSAFVRLDGNLRQLRMHLAKNAKLTGGAVFHELTPQKAVVDAITTAKLKPATDPDRLIVFLGETGSGKTALARELKVMHDGVLVEGRESWRDSYYAAVCDIAAAAGVSEGELDPGKHAAEAALLRRLRAHRRVLIIDEGEYFGPRTANLLKLLLNQTETVIVLMAIPVLFRRWQEKAWAESVQLSRRSHAVIDAQLVDPKDVLKFIGRRFVVEGDLNKFCAIVAKAANAFGRYDTVVRILDELAPEECVTPEDAEQAVRNMKRMLNRGE